MDGRAGIVSDPARLVYESAHPGVRGRGPQGTTIVGDGLVPSRLVTSHGTRASPQQAGDHNAPARARGRPYGGAIFFGRTTGVGDGPRSLRPATALRAVARRGVLGRWGLGPDGEVRAVWRRCPVPLFPVQAAGMPSAGDHKGRPYDRFDHAWRERIVGDGPGSLRPATALRAVARRGVLGRWGLGPDGEVRAVWRRCPVPLFDGEPVGRRRRRVCGRPQRAR